MIMTMKPEALDHCQEQLSEHAQLLNACTLKTDAKLFLNIMCDSLSWSDEKPDGEDSFEFMRFLSAMFFFRTAKISEPGEYDFQRVLDTAKTVAPAWAFNEPTRHLPELAQQLKELREKADVELNAAFEMSRKAGQ